MAPCAQRLKTNRFDSSILDIELFIPQCSIFRKDRQFLGGGLFIYIHEHINSYHRNDLGIFTVIMVRIETLLCCTYRPPSSEVVWLDLFSDSLDISFNENKETIMFGDFNYDIYESSHG